MTDTLPLQPDYTALPPLPHRCRIAILAVGGGACAALPVLLEGWDNPPTVAALNTDATALNALNVPLSVAIGQNSTRGLGTAGDPAAGAMAAEEDADAIRTLLSGHDLLLLVASLGGGTGSGVAPVVARMARQQGLLTLAYVTTPFAFEDPRRIEVAEAALERLRREADAVVRLPNEALRELFPPDTPLLDAFRFSNRMIATALRGLWTLLSRNNVLNLDFADVQALVEHSGNECRFGYGEGTGPDRARAAVDALLSGPLLERGRVVANAGSLLVNIVGDDKLTLNELNVVRTAIGKVAVPGARIRFGAAVLSPWDGRLAVTVLAAEHAPPRAAAVPDPSPARDSSPAPARRSGRAAQAVLPFDAPAPAASPSSAPASELDVPTYIRRGIVIPS